MVCLWQERPVVTNFIDHMEGTGALMVELGMWATTRMLSLYPGTLSVVVLSLATSASSQARVDTLEVRLLRVLGALSNQAPT